MRKVLFLVTTLVISMFVMLDVNASNFKLDFVGNETFKEEVTLNLQVNNLDGFTGSCNGLCGLVGTLEYDKEKIEITEIKPLESFTLAQGRKLVLYKAIGVSSGTNILAIKIRNKELAAGETTTISLNNIVASDGDKDISTANISKTIKLEGKQNNVNSETQNKPSTSESTTNINKQNDSTSKKKKTEEKKSTNS